MLEPVLQAVTFCVLVGQLLLELLDFVLRLFLALGYLVNIVDLLLEALFQIELNKNRVFFQVKQMADLCLHLFVFFLQFHNRS